MNDSDWTESSSDELAENHVQVPLQFHGVYFLLSKNPKFKGRTYIGYTVNPIRRLKQHNGGIKKGGARKTSGRGPWDMILIVHGFPNDIAALRFEWAWQHPSKSRRIDSSVVKHVSRETSLQFKLRILSYMLSVGPWHRLPLTIRWLKQDYEQYYPATVPPPVHMPMLYGAFEMTKEGISCKICIQDDRERKMLCQLCGQEKLESMCASFLHCYHESCLFMAHITCFAVKFCSDDEVIPVVSTCPSCSGELLWGQLIKSCSEVSYDTRTCNLQLV